MDDFKTEYDIADDLNALKTIFPNKVCENEYRILLKVLYEEYSDRNLAELMARFTDKSYEEVYNDILGSSQSSISEQEMQGTVELLRKAGMLEIEA
ncbi:MAG: hypothetical protein IJ716_11685 [Lachnospiraceae bacterium]|nr:hypothetical protein [Lachnospiraceae bacterium]